ncbi:3-hydroxyacyl-CoA dehydrogenase family protein [Halorubrum sp. DTA46]|uniref:3-hydroxyacyl-CoA dehydrogenase family protein n=1 Tax=Halorubrum sp. DTA46 TaxID=3402162 RepID=UPI003AAECF85
MHVTVLGAGTMGRGIAHVAAFAGHEVSLRDVEDGLVSDGIAGIADALDEGVERDVFTREAADAALNRIAGTTDLERAAAGADVLVEAVPEDLELKRRVLGDAEAFLTDDALIASNTSSIPVTAIASALDAPERFCGLHFFNPVHRMALVEVVVGERTGEQTRERAVSFVEGIGKEAVVVRDAPGFASSRLGVALGAEAIRMVESGVAAPAEIDRAMTLGYNHPVGPLELTDIVGLDVRLDILETLRTELGERFRPPQLLRRKVRAGKLGRKAGEGFYRWEGGEIVDAADAESDSSGSIER